MIVNEFSRLLPAGFDNYFIVQDDKLVGILYSGDIFQEIDREMTLSPV